MVVELFLSNLVESLAKQTGHTIFLSVYFVLMIVDCPRKNNVSH